MRDYPNISAGTQESPRFVSDTLVFYQGDVFDVEFEFDITGDDTPVMIGAEDKVRFTFIRPHCLPGAVEVEIPGSEITDNVAVLHWTEELTRQFRRGHYEYRIQYINQTGIVTVAAGGQMIVE